MKRITVNAYTAESAADMVTREMARQGIPGRVVRAVEAPAINQLPNSKVAIYVSLAYAGPEPRRTYWVSVIVDRVPVTCPCGWRAPHDPETCEFNRKAAK